MKMRLEDKIKAINLRIEGKTHREIRLQIPNLAKSTLSNWLSGLKLTPKQEKKLKNNLKKINYNAKARSAWTHRKKKKEKNPDYKGCIQLRVLKTAFYWRVMGWLKELTTEYNL